MKIENLDDNKIKEMMESDDIFLQKIGKYISEKKSECISFIINARTLDEKEYYRGVLNGFGESAVNMINYYLSLSSEEDSDAV